jgi:hypothetical protein
MAPVLRRIPKRAHQATSAIADTRGESLAREVKNLSITEHLEWADREFKTRGIDVRNDK